MFTTGRAARAAVAAACALAVAAGCSSGNDGGPDGLISVITMRGALLQPKEVGPAWTAPEETAAPQRMVSLCGGTSTPPSFPPGAELVTSSLVDEGDKGAQTLDQTALVFPDESLARAGQAALQAVAESCQANLSVPAAQTSDRNEPAYTESVSLRPLKKQGGWTGFAVIRHKKYEAAHPGTADTAVAVLTVKNVVLIDAYAIYHLDNATPSPSFDADWQRLVGTVVQRVG